MESQTYGPVLFSIGARRHGSVICHGLIQVHRMPKLSKVCLSPDNCAIDFHIDTVLVILPHNPVPDE